MYSAWRLFVYATSISGLLLFGLSMVEFQPSISRRRRQNYKLSDAQNFIENWRIENQIVRNRTKPVELLVYNRIPKTGSNTVMAVLLRLSERLLFNHEVSRDYYHLNLTAEEEIDFLETLYKSSEDKQIHNERYEKYC